MTDINSNFERISAERKEAQARGFLPDWYTTQGYQLFKEKYAYEDDLVYGRHKTIAKTLVQHLPEHLRNEFEKAFFDLMWRGILSPATPTLANVGTNRGLGVSCAGQYIGDSVDSFYSNLHEAAVLSKHGFGTSGDFSAIRPRGSTVSTGGVANGAKDVIDDFFTMSLKINQGGNRRGAFAAYIDAEHPDFWECIEELNIYANGKNYGWNIYQSFIDKLKAGDKEANKRFQYMLKIKLIHGKGYFFFPDKANEHRPQMYKDLGLDIKASNLCSEICLHSSEEYSFSCILASLNLVHWDEIKDSKAIFYATVFLDCLTSDFLVSSAGINGLEKVRAFTEKGRAIGLGVMGLHTLFQKRRIPMDGLEAAYLDKEIFSTLAEESLKASQWLAKELGEPEWCQGYGVRNTHRICIAPTKSTALLMGGVSEGINPDPGMCFTASSAVGELTRITPEFYELMKEKGVYSQDTVSRIIKNIGSVQNEDWLTDEEKKAFKTAFEINQMSLLRMAAARQKYICQGQSLNFFVGELGSEKLVAKLITECFTNPNILGQYYIYSRSGVVINDECTACSA